MRSNPHKSDKQTKSNKPIEVHNKTGKCPFFGGTNWQSEVIDHSAFVFSIPKKKQISSINKTQTYTTTHFSYTK